MTREDLGKRKEKAQRAERITGAVLAASIVACALAAVLFYQWYERTQSHLTERMRQDEQRIVGKE